MSRGLQTINNSFGNHRTSVHCWPTSGKHPPKPPMHGHPIPRIGRSESRDIPSALRGLFGAYGITREALLTNNDLRNESGGRDLVNE